MAVYTDNESRQAFTPVAILLIQWAFRLDDPNKKLAVIVLMISSGVALASHGELRFNLIGFVTQAAAVAVSHVILPARDRITDRSALVRGIQTCHDPGPPA